jgi:hypothetical protein
MAGLSNVYLIINLGCEMVYVIDQRLKAQNIPLDKSAQGNYTTNSLLWTFFLLIFL